MELKRLNQLVPAAPKILNSEEAKDPQEPNQIDIVIDDSSGQPPDCTKKSSEESLQISDNHDKSSANSGNEIDSNNRSINAGSS